MIAGPLKTFSLVCGLLWSWCDSDRVAIHAEAPTVPIAAPAEVCTPLTGPDSDRVEIVVACEGCRQQYFSGAGLPVGDSFAACVDRKIVSVRAKLAIDPKRYDSVLPTRQKRAMSR